MTYRIAAVLAYVAAVIAANWATTTYGMLPVGFGQTATAGTYLAGLSFVLRDSLQDAWGRRGVAASIAVAALLSYVVADPFIATASAAAFLFSETADTLVYTPLRRRGYLRAALASNVIGSLVDSFAFLLIAGFPLSALTGQMVAKVTITALVVVGVVIGRAVLRQPVHR